MTLVVFRVWSLTLVGPCSADQQRKSILCGSATEINMHAPLTCPPARHMLHHLRCRHRTKAVFPQSSTAHTPSSTLETRRITCFTSSTRAGLALNSNCWCATAPVDLPRPCFVRLIRYSNLPCSDHPSPPSPPRAHALPVATAYPRHQHCATQTSIADPSNWDAGNNAYSDRATYAAASMAVVVRRFADRAS